VTLRRPRIIAEQARHARGLLGWIIASIMARETWAANLEAIDALEIGAREHVLDVGCGHGRGLAAIAARAPGVRVAGVDPSALMVQIARRRSRRLIGASRVEVMVAGVEALPFADGAFDRALCVHGVYFWPDLEAGLTEIARVLRPGGRLALLFRTDADTAAVRSFPSEVYHFPPLQTVITALAAAGFSSQVAEGNGGDCNGPVLLVAERMVQPAGRRKSGED